MKKLTSTNSLDEMLSQHEYSLLYFSASWCGPCRSMSPMVEKLSDTMSDRFNTIKVDVDSTPAISSDYGIRSIPTLLLVKNKEVISQKIGGLPQQQLTQWLEQLT